MTSSWDFNTATLLAIAINFIGGIVFMVRTDGRSKSGLALAEKNEKRIDAYADEIDRRFDGFNRGYQDTFSALRQKIVEVELFGRDNYIKAAPFNEAMHALREEILRNRQESAASIEKLSEKFDRIITRSSPD